MFFTDQTHHDARSRLGGHGTINKAFHVGASDLKRTPLTLSLCPEFTILFYFRTTDITLSMSGSGYSRCTR